MTVRTTTELLLELSTGGSSGNKVSHELIRDVIDTLDSIATSSTELATALAAGTAIIVLPSADPNVVGALWNDAGTITVSAG